MKRREKQTEKVGWRGISWFKSKVQICTGTLKCSAPSGEEVKCSER